MNITVYLGANKGNDDKLSKAVVELGDVFIAFPGGTGTLEEISEIMSKISLKQINSPCILYNLDGYYDGLKILLNKMIEKNLSSYEKLKGIYFVNNLEDIKKIIMN